MQEFIAGTYSSGMRISEDSQPLVKNCVASEEWERILDKNSDY
jgi:hypothetical protein